MDIGLLWFDNDPRRALTDKITKAAQRYHEKHGRWPDTCYVHPNAVADSTEQQQQVACRSGNGRTTIRVLSAPNIFPHHLWLGVGVPETEVQHRGRAKGQNCR